VVEKGIKIKNYSWERLDVIVGCFIAVIVAYFIVLACTATIFVSGHRQLSSAADAALALRPLAGNAASALFAFGLVNAAIFSASILPLATAYSVCEGLGFESGINKRMREAPTFYFIYTGLIVLGALAVLILPENRQIPIILLSQVANGILLPIVLLFMLRLCNRQDLMGKHTNSRLFNIIAWITCIVTTTMTLLLVLSGLFPSWFPK
jgi:Mn2+/Fe2+ NRAMP family transporter